MELLKKILKSLLIGTLGGVCIALLTQFFVPDLIDRLEYVSYYMRYRWIYDELPDRAGEAQKQQKSEYGIYIVDIDERSQQKLGAYWNWNRSYHAQMINALNKMDPAAIVFDIMFFDPEDHNQATRLQNVLRRSDEVQPPARLTDRQRNSILSVIDYDRRFVEATRNAGNVIHGMRLADENDYATHALSQVKQNMTMAWHNKLHPSSAITLAPEVKEKVAYRKTILDGIFPELAQAAQDIGHLNIVPNEDGIIREVPLLYTFGDHDPIYLPISLRTVATLFGTPNEEIIFKPGKYIDIGRPFKVFKNEDGRLRCSYPQVSPNLVRALIDNADAIRGLAVGEQVEISTYLKIGRREDGEVYADMYNGELPQQLLGVMLDTGIDTILALNEGEVLELGPRMEAERESEIDWVLRAPFGDEEWYLSAIDFKTLRYLSKSDFSTLAPDSERLLFRAFSVRRTPRGLVSSIPVLRNRTLLDICGVRWDKLTALPAGKRWDFGRNVRIPLTHDNQHIITYFGPKAQPFPYYSYYDIMAERVHGQLEGGIFIVGSTIPAMFDIKAVPHDRNYPAVEVHASIMNSILTDTFVRRLERWQDLAILILAGVIMGIISYMLKPLWGAIITVVLIFAYFVFALTIFGNNFLWIEIVRPVLTVILTFTAVMAYRYITEEKDRKYLQSTFKRYLSPELIDQMYKQKHTPELGGEEGVRTAYFTDIQSFSTFSEKLGSPTRLVELLNEYLTAMTDTLLEHYGTLDKYEGDAIIAFFGAPMPMDDHALQACKTALGMQNKLGELRAKWTDEGDKWPKIVHEMRMRIGVNTGTITTGNMGSAMRMNYTMMGDAVNLAARLESAAKQYGVYTMISEATHQLVGGEFECRQTDKITVVGKSEPVVVYELMAEKGALSSEQQALVAKYNEGLGCFYDQQWDKAIQILSESEKMEPFRDVAPKNMSPSRKIIEYCEDFKQNPPGPDWDGVIRLTSK